jgi:hypothetical protein
LVGDRLEVHRRWAEIGSFQRQQIEIRLLPPLGMGQGGYLSCGRNILDARDLDVAFLVQLEQESLDLVLGAVDVEQDVGECALAVDRGVHRARRLVTEDLRSRGLARVAQDDAGVVQHATDVLHLVDPLQSAQQDVVDAQLHGKGVDSLIDGFLEAEHCVPPVEEAVDDLLDLGRELGPQLVGCERAHFYQGLAQESRCFLLDGQRLAQLLLGDLLAREQELTEPLGRIVRRAADHLALAHTHALCRPVPFHSQGPGLARGAQPLQQVGQRHGRKGPNERHTCKLLQDGI